MSDLARIGVAIESKLLASFDALIAKLGYTNRSEAFRDLIRERLVREGSENPNQEVVGALTLVYDHHKRNLNDKLTELQHDHHANIVSTLHVHLDHDNCLEVLILRGKAKKVRKIAELLISVKGIQHGQLAISAPNAEKLSAHSHTHNHSH
jgi:CopG family nickel-responsive transcriptional regulator